MEQELEADREFAVNSPMPQPDTAASGVFCHPGCHQIKFKYGTPVYGEEKKGSTARKEKESAVHLK